MKRLAWLLFALPIVVSGQTIDVTSTDGLTKTITVTTTGPTGPAGAVGPAGPAFTGGTLTTPVLGTAANNCAAIPYSFDSDATTGVCSTAAGTLNFYTSNVSRLGLASTAATFTTPILAANGAITGPAYSFASAAFDGMEWIPGGFGGLYIQSEGPFLNISLDNGHDALGARSALNFHTTNGTLLVNYATAAQYASLTVAGSGPTNTLYVHDGSDINTITQSSTDTTFDQRVTFTGLPATTGCTSKSLTDAGAAVTFARVAVATNSYTAGEFEWVATSTDATDQIVTFGKQPIVGVDKVGTVSCATSAQYATTTKATNANTLVCTVTVLTSTTNCDAQVTCTNNTGGNQAIDFCWRLDMPTAMAVVVP